MEAPASTLVPLSREDAVRLLRGGEAELRALGVTHISLFGSIARGDALPDSDIDVVIDHGVILAPEQVAENCSRH